MSVLSRRLAEAAGRFLGRRVPEGPLRLCFVTPWYGPDVPGGMESQTRRTLGQLVRSGVQVRVLTTCIQDFFADWSVNVRPPGPDLVDGIPVHRFLVKPRRGEAFGRINDKLLAGETLEPSEVQVFEQEMIRCPSLLRHIRATRHTVDLFVFIPYLYATTYLGARECPGQAVLIPCLHDEGYARLPFIHRCFLDAQGLLFNSPAELRLAQRLYGVSNERCALAGEGVETGWTGEGERFRKKYGVREYLLYVGRKEAGKNFPLLLEYFLRYRAARAPHLSLVVLGPGRTLGKSQGILDLGFLPEEEKHDALAGAVALVQPSLLESFSLTVMESWLARRPVMVHADCEVTYEHCVTSQGGMWFRSYPEFAAALDRLRADGALAEQMGRKGAKYVEDHFTWPKVLGKYLAALSGFRERAWAAPSGLRIFR